MYRYDVNEFLVTAMREDPVSQYSAWALCEFLMNAIIHRDYFLGNAPIKFYEYKKNKIEISNPGGLFGRANPDNFPFVNDYRNPLLAEFRKMRRSEERTKSCKVGLTNFATFILCFLGVRSVQALKKSRVSGKYLELSSFV